MTFAAIIEIPVEITTIGLMLREDGDHKVIAICAPEEAVNYIRQNQG